MRVSGYTYVTSVSPVVDTNAYAAGDLIGAKLSLSNVVRHSGGTGIIHSVRVIDQDNEKIELDLIFFKADPAATTFTDNAAFDIADADMVKIIGHVKVLTGDYISLADNSVATKGAIGLPFQLTSGYTMYLAIVVRAAVTYTAATDLVIEVSILQD